MRPTRLWAPSFLILSPCHWTAPHWTPALSKEGRALSWSRTGHSTVTSKSSSTNPPSIDLYGIRRRSLMPASLHLAESGDLPRTATQAGTGEFPPQL
jgi:hypothetical protein